jgi:hypothetical protein
MSTAAPVLVQCCGDQSQHVGGGGELMNALLERWDGREAQGVDEKIVTAAAIYSCAVRVKRARTTARAPSVANNMGIRARSAYFPPVRLPMTMPKTTSRYVMAGSANPADWR